MSALMVTVYTAPSCAACQMTKIHLDRRGIPYAEQSIMDDQNREAALELGYTSAPIVCATGPAGDEHWSGYRPDRIDALAEVVS